jgi:hypothetical protein
MISQVITNGLQHQKVSNFSQVFYSPVYFILLQDYEIGNKL